ncbi:MAG: GNAT family N-acetyltransferase [Alphaproteobacteria bacterium]|nr:GNAT family N-acetyltransferase [Alphaproteobacteria bacterium]
MSQSTFSPIEKIAPHHDVAEFGCGQPARDLFLKKHALGNLRANAALTYVVCRANSSVVSAYYSLAVGSVDPVAAPQRVTAGLARHPVPIMILARLAVDRRYQGFGIGRALLKDSLVRTAEAADIAGVRAIAVHAKDEKARAWYAKFDFEPSPTDPFHLFLLMKDLRAILAR